MVTVGPGFRCAMVQLYCSEQIAIPEHFPNVLKKYAKAAIRTQPYDILRWSLAYFRCLANDAPPPEKCRLERECRQGSITRGYLKVLVAQVGKGFFISRCQLHERWKALCLPEEELLKYLSLCRMLHWPQIHWLKLLAVLAASLCPSLQESMIMVCELLSDDVEGGPARVPYWMFKICYTFVAKLDCSREQCFINGQLVLPWGDLEDVKPMDTLPKVLSPTLLKDTILTTCKAKLDTPGHPIKPLCCALESASNTTTTDFMTNFAIDNRNEVICTCEDFDTIILLLEGKQADPILDKDFIAPHVISDTQIKNAQTIETAVYNNRLEQAKATEAQAMDYLHKEAEKLLREVGPPWTWLHQFTTADHNTRSYNFIDQASIASDVTPETSSIESFDIIKEEPVKSEEEISTSSCFCVDVEEEEEEKRQTIDSLKSLLDEAGRLKLCDMCSVCSVITFLKSEELGVLQRASEPNRYDINMKQIICILERAEAKGLNFQNLGQLLRHVRSKLWGKIDMFPPKPEEPPQPPPPEGELPYFNPDSPKRSVGSLEIPPEWVNAPPKPVPEKPAPPPKEEEDEQDEEETPTKEDIYKIFESSVGIPPEQASKMPKFCFEPKDSDDKILGLIPLQEEVEEEQSIDTGSELPESSGGIPFEGSGYVQDDSDLLDEEDTPRKPRCNQLEDQWLNFYCCKGQRILKTIIKMPPPQFRCVVQPFPGIGPPVSDKVIDEFLGYLRLRARSHCGLTQPRQFKEEDCPLMIDTYEK